MEELEGAFDGGGEIIYKARNTIKVLPWREGTVNVKKFAAPNLINRYVYRWLREPKCVRAYEYADRLMSLGVDTPQPIGYILHTSGMHIGESYLVTFQSYLRRNFYEFDKGGVAGREDIIRGLARFAADMHDKGVLHKDFSPGNILFDENPSGGYSYSIVDINRMKFGKVSVEEGCVSFRRLWGGLDFLRVLSDAYAEYRKADLTHVYSEVVKHHKKFWHGMNDWY